MPTDHESAADLELTRASADLASARDSFVLSMGALEAEVTHALDWRAWVRRRPGLALGLVFGIGFIFGRRHRGL